MFTGFHVRKMNFGLIVVLVSLCCVGCVGVKYIIFAPSDEGILSDDTLANLAITKLELNTADSETLHALFLANDDSTLLTFYFHGNGGNVHNRVAALKKLSSLGTSVLAISYRGYPLSTGKPSPQGIVEDAKTALKYATEQLGYKDADIVLIGRSLGSTVATVLASESTYHGLVLVTPFTNAKDLYEAQRAVRRLLLTDSDNFINTGFRNSDYFPLIKTPTLVVHGTQDKPIPYRLGEMVFDSLKSKKKMLTLDGIGHNDFGYAAQSRADALYWQAVKDVIDSKWSLP